VRFLELLAAHGGEQRPRSDLEDGVYASPIAYVSTWRSPAQRHITIFEQLLPARVGLPEEGLDDFHHGCALDAHTSGQLDVRVGGRRSGD
jgi:hypothetical protein